MIVGHLVISLLFKFNIYKFFNMHHFLLRIEIVISFFRVKYRKISFFI